MANAKNKYISVLANEAQDTASLTLAIKSMNQVPEVVLSTEVEVEPTDNEADICDNIIQTLVPYLTDENALYNGQPYFGAGNVPFADQYWPYPGVNPYGPLPFTFRPYQTDHILNIFSQANFRLNIPEQYKVNQDEPENGLYIISGSQPVLFTADDVRTYAPQASFELKNPDGSPMSTMQICNLAICLSAVVHLFLGGYQLAATTYMHEDRGYGDALMSFLHTPIITCDFPWVRGARPLTGISPTGSPVKVNFDLDYTTGVFTFAEFGFNPYYKRPKDFDNFVRVSYVAGRTSIPVSIKISAMQLLPYVRNPYNISKLKVGSFSIDFERNKEAIDAIKTNIRQVVGLPV